VYGNSLPVCSVDLFSWPTQKWRAAAGQEIAIRTGRPIFYEQTMENCSHKVNAIARIRAVETIMMWADTRSPAQSTETTPLCKLVGERFFLVMAVPGHTAVAVTDLGRKRLPMKMHGLLQQRCF
jgi:hypothetical protein